MKSVRSLFAGLLIAVALLAAPAPVISWAASGLVSPSSAVTEGTFTAGLSFGNGTTGLTYIARTARYTKVGRLVTFNLYVRIDSKGSSTGAVRITGLPFASENTANMQSAMSVWTTGMVVTVGGIMGLNDPNTTTVQLYYSGTGTATVATDPNVTDGAEFSVSGSYMAAS
jgi:hypothetical protein